MKDIDSKRIAGGLEFEVKGYCDKLFKTGLQNTVQVPMEF